MSTGVPPCRTVTVHTFLGNRAALGRRVRKALDDASNGVGPGPSPLECLLYAGHTGVSTDADRAIYGFNPDLGNLPTWQGMQRLRNGDAFPGVVVDDTQVFAAATAQRMKVQTFEVLLPDPDFQEFERRLLAERATSRYTYGFPNGDGDCNCVTWLVFRQPSIDRFRVEHVAPALALGACVTGQSKVDGTLERLALPLLSGSMDEFAGLPGFGRHPRRRFGGCV